jgi:hypothetical protein
MADNVLQALAGLNLDSIDLQVKEGQLRYALNAVVSGLTEEMVTYSNESGSLFMHNFGDYKAIGADNITEINRVVYFLTNPNTGDSEIGYSDHGGPYTTLVSDKGNDQKFNFSIDHPIHKVISKVTNCSVQIYWTDGYNPRRYLDFTELPWKDSISAAGVVTPLVGQLDANKLLVQPNFSIPSATPSSVAVGGQLETGTYQFAVQYTNDLGEGYTSFYNVSNPLGIFNDAITNDFSRRTSNAIRIEVTGLDTTGLYEHFNIAVIKTIDGITSVELVGTFPIEGENYSYIFTGVDVQPLKLSMNEIFEKTPYYDIADDITEVEAQLMWAGLKNKTELNYQKIWANVHLYWETWAIPYTRFEGYKNGYNTMAYKGYMRDEVYAFEGVFFLKNGKQTKRFHIPGRIATSYDRSPVNNSDSRSITKDKCHPSDNQKERWQVYNTASLIGTTVHANDPCYIGPYQFGEFSFWESSDTYPDNQLIWGDLHGQKIRHHKFPDSTLTHIHDNNEQNLINYEHTIYPLGARVDINSLWSAIHNSDLSDDEKAMIVGFKIVRGNRAVNNTVVAKGIFNNVGKYKKAISLNPKDISDPANYQEFFYPNYPYNDLNTDPFFSNHKLEDHAGYNPDWQQAGFGDYSRSRFTFHSPDTHFFQPSVSNDGFQMKIETIQYGQSRGHFMPVERNAEYKFLASEAYYAAVGMGIASGMNMAAGTFGWPTMTIGNIIPGYNAAVELFKKIIVPSNFGLTYHSIGSYNNFLPVATDVGNKIRNISHIQYLIDGYYSVEDNNLFNNYRRESSIYIHTDETNGLLNYTHEYDTRIPQDNSRYSLATESNLTLLSDFLQLFIQHQGDITKVIHQDSIQQAVDGFLAAKEIHDQRIVLFTSGNMDATVGVPKSGDIYQDSVNSYVIGDVVVKGVLPSNPMNPPPIPQVYFVITASVQNYDANTYQSPSGGLKLSFQGGDPADEGVSPSPIPIVSADDSTFVTASSVTKVTTDTVTAFLNGITNATQEYIDNLRYSDINNEQAAYSAYYIEFNKYYADHKLYKAPEEIKTKNISSYYGSIKRILDNPYGQIRSFDIVDTGYYQPLYDSTGNKITSGHTVFGGDTFINRFALKTKLPFYTDNTVDNPDMADIEYDKIGNLGYPMYWLSTKPPRIDIDVHKQIGKVIDVISNSPGMPGGSFWSKVWTIIKGIFSGGFANTVPMINLMLTVFMEIYKKTGKANVNLDNYKLNGLAEEGLMYLFSYGIPYFFVESGVNVDYRQAINQTYGNFYPNVGEGIPDHWLQEVQTPIIHDNDYTYNITYSKQNKENFYDTLPENYDPTKPCQYEFPNRVIWSVQSSMGETKNHWLVYKPANRFDLTKSYGKLTAIDSLQHGILLARFENKSQLYNALVTIDTSTYTAALGSDKLLSNSRPLDLSHTDIGSAGSQNKFMLKIDEGVIFVDAKRGQVLLLSGQQVTDMTTSGMSKWFKENLPFKILKYFPNVDTDNHFKGIGLTGAYDAANKRIILTKLDYEPIVQGIVYGDGVFRDSLKNIISLTDPTYFCSKSWTISFSLDIKNWVSWHSYQPNYYVAFPLEFQTGFNDTGTVWSHNKTKVLYNNFNGTLYPYIIEYPFVAKTVDEILQDVRDLCEVRVYDAQGNWNSPSDTIYYNKAVIYNKEQCTGILNLIPRPKNNLAAYMTYPKYRADSKDIILTRADNEYRFNTFWNINTSTLVPFLLNSCDSRFTDKTLNSNNLDYGNRNHKKETIRGRNANIRLILDNRDDVKLISKFVIPNTTNSSK